FINPVCGITCVKRFVPRSFCPIASACRVKGLHPMAVTITPLPFSPDQIPAGDLLRITGDIEQRLIIPAKPKREDNGETWVETYYVALSDGSFIRAVNDAERPDFVIVLAGPAGVMVDETGLSLSVPGKIE